MKLEIIQDTGAESPRNWDNLTIMALFKRHGSFGDEVSFDPNDFNSWDEMESFIKKELDVAIIKPVYMYSHSGDTISTTPFACRWDSGQVGFVYVTKEKARSEYSCKRITRKIIEKVDNVLEAEIETFDMYIRGDVYGYQLNDDNGEEVDSCWGFFGSDPEKNGMLSHIPKEFHDNLSVVMN
jgi:hypothetical protein